MYIRVFNWGLKPSSWTVRRCLWGICLHLTVFFFICCGVTSLPKANWRSVFGLTVGAAAEPRRKASGFRFWAPAGSSVWFRWRSYSGLGYLKVHILICVDDGDVKQIAPSRAHAHTSTAAGEDDMLQVFFLVRLITWCVVLLSSNVESSLETKEKFEGFFYSLTSLTSEKAFV